MKKFLLLIIVLCGIFAFSTSAVAADGVQSYLNFNLIFDGDATVEIPGMSKAKDDLSGIVLKGGISLNNWKAAFEYHDGEVGDGDYELLYLQGGYRIVDAYSSKVDVMLGKLNIETDGTELDGLLLGVEYMQFLSEKFAVTATLGYSLDGSYETGPVKDDDVDTTIYRVNISYIFNEKLIGSIVYTNLNYSFFHPLVSAEADVTLAAWSAGLTYRF